MGQARGLGLILPHATGEAQRQRWQPADPETRAQQMQRGIEELSDPGPSRQHGGMADKREAGQDQTAQDQGEAGPTRPKPLAQDQRGDQRQMQRTCRTEIGLAQDRPDRAGIEGGRPIARRLCGLDQKPAQPAEREQGEEARPKPRPREICGQRQGGASICRKTPPPQSRRAATNCSPRIMISASRIRPSAYFTEKL